MPRLYLDASSDAYRYRTHGKHPAFPSYISTQLYNSWHPDMPEKGILNLWIQTLSPGSLLSSLNLESSSLIFSLFTSLAGSVLVVLAGEICQVMCARQGTCSRLFFLEGN